MGSLLVPCLTVWVAVRILTRVGRETLGGLWADTLFSSCLLGVLVRAIIAMMKHDDQKLRREAFIWLTLLHHSPSSKQVRMGTQTGQEPRGKS